MNRQLIEYSLKDRKVVGITPYSQKKSISMEYSLDQRRFTSDIKADAYINIEVMGYSLNKRQWVTEEMLCKTMPSPCL